MTLNADRIAAERVRMIRDGEIDDPRFRRLGAGISRVAFLDTETNVVYKAQRRGQSWANVDEHRNSTVLGDITLPTGAVVHFPETALFCNNTVIAMPFIDGAFTTCDNTYGGPCTCGEDMCFDDVHEYIRARGIEDAHHENVLATTDGDFWVIDMAD